MLSVFTKPKGVLTADRLPVVEQHQVVCRDDISGLFFLGHVEASHVTAEDFDELTDEELASSDAAADAVAYSHDPYVHSRLYSVRMQDGSIVVQAQDHCFSKESEKSGFLEAELSEGDGVVALYFDAVAAGRSSPDPAAAGTEPLYAGGGDVYAPAIVETVDFIGHAAELRFYDGKLIRVPLDLIFAVGEETYENARDYIISVVD
jgi:hypothetical protein